MFTDIGESRLRVVLFNTEEMSFSGVSVSHIWVECRISGDILSLATCGFRRNYLLTSGITLFVTSWVGHSLHRNVVLCYLRSRSALHVFSTCVIGLDWIVQCLTSPPTQYRLYGRRFLQVKRPNQQYQSTEGSYKRQIKQRKQHKHTCRDNNAHTKRYTHIKHSKSPSLQ